MTGSSAAPPNSLLVFRYSALAIFANLAYWAPILTFGPSAPGFRAILPVEVKAQMPIQYAEFSAPSAPTAVCLRMTDD